MSVLIGNWWTLVLRGIVAILFGVLIFMRPGMGLMTLILMFGVYSMLDGMFNLMAAFRHHPGDQGEPGWDLVIQGIFGLLVGGLALFLPDLTAITLLYLIAAWTVLMGIFSIVNAIHLRRHVPGECVLVSSGALSAVIGFLVMIFPGAGAIALLIWIGAYALFHGGLLISLGLTLGSWSRRHHGEHPTNMSNVVAGH